MGLAFFKSVQNEAAGLASTRRALHPANPPPVLGREAQEGSGVALTSLGGARRQERKLV